MMLQNVLKTHTFHQTSHAGVHGLAKNPGKGIWSTIQSTINVQKETVMI